MKGEVGEGSEENPSVLDAERGGGALSPLPLLLREIAHQGPSLLAWVLLQPRMLSEASRCEGFCPFFWCAVFRWLHKLDILSYLLLE